MIKYIKTVNNSRFGGNDMKQSKRMKNIFKAVIIVLILFIPTYFAISSYFSAKDAPVERKSITSLELCDMNGAYTSFDRSTDEGKQIIDILTDIHDTARTIPSLPKDLEGAPSIEVSFHSYDLTTKYNYYFSATKPSSSYYTDHEGNAFLMDASAAIAFLDSDFSASLYDASTPPCLNLHGTMLRPTEADWTYSSYSGVTHTPSIELADDGFNVSCSYREFAPIFDREPTSADVKISDTLGRVLFEGNLTELSESEFIRKNIKADAKLNIDIDAVWEKSSGSNAGGQFSYRLSVDIIFDPLASFWLGEKEIEDGEFVVLSGKYTDVSDLSEIKVSVAPDIGYTPKFYSDGDCIRALIPFGYSKIESATEYKITIGYLGKTIELPIKVTPLSAKIKERKYNYKGVIEMSTRSDENFKDFSKLIATLPICETRYFDGTFLTPDESQNRARFGDTVNNGTEEQKHISNGIAWVCYKSQSVLATNKGKVSYVGETKMGGVTVVIDHGFGLRSVYYCLDSANVSEGDIVEKGAEIGKGGGKKGYTDDHTCYFELWIGDIPVSYYPLIEGGRNGEVAVGSYE